MSETRRLHPLHEATFICEHIENTGHYFPVNRRTGRTTAHCLRVLAAAIANPDVWICFKDHNGTTLANRYMLEQVQRMEQALDLKYMTHAYTGSEAMVCFSRRPPDRNLMRNRVVQE